MLFGIGARRQSGIDLTSGLHHLELAGSTVTLETFALACESCPENLDFGNSHRQKELARKNKNPALISVRVQA